MTNQLLIFRPFPTPQPLPPVQQTHILLSFILAIPNYTKLNIKMASSILEDTDNPPQSIIWEQSLEGLVYGDRIFLEGLNETVPGNLRFTVLNDGLAVIDTFGFLSLQSVGEIQSSRSCRSHIRIQFCTPSCSYYNNQ